MHSTSSEESAVLRRFPIISVLKGIALFCGLAVMITGCTTPPAYPTRPTAECKYKATKEGVTVGVQPVFDQQELRQYFNTDLVNRGILPVLVVVQNNSAGDSYLLAKTNCILLEAEGFAGKENLPTRNYALWIPGGIIGGAIFIDAGITRATLTDKELNDQSVSPGEAGQGFVYFIMPKEPPAKGGFVSLRVRLPQMGADQELDLDLPIQWER